MSLTSEQIELRRKSIGGSDIGAILGENPYKTAYEVWEEKVEGKSVDFSKNRGVVIGNLLEEELVNFYEKLKNKICIRNLYHVHENYNFLSSNLDAIVVSENPNDVNIDRYVLEIKTASRFNIDEWGPEGSQIVPSSYYAQISHYMMITNLDRADIYVGFIDESVVGDILCEMNRVIGNIDPTPDFSEIVEKMEKRLYTFYRDPEMEELMLESAKSFYNDHMKTWIEHGIKNPPPMDFSNKKFQDCLRKKYSIQADSVIKLPSEYMEIKDKYVSFMLQSKSLDKLAQEEKSKILAAIGNNEKAILDDGSYFLRKTIKRKECFVKSSEYIKFEFKQPKEK